MARKRYRVIVDVEVDILEITTEQIQKSNAERAVKAQEFGWTNIDRSVPPDEDLAPLRELQERLMQDPQLLDQWVKHEVFADIQSGSLNDFHYDFNEEDFLKGIVERLSPRARHRLRESIARGEMIEEMEPFWESFDCTPKSIVIAEI